MIYGALLLYLLVVDHDCLRCDVVGGKMMS